MSAVPTLRAFVDTSGRLVMSTPEQHRYKAWLHTLADEQVDVIVRKRKNQRSIDQNAWVWSVAYPLIAEAIGYDAHEHDDLHYALVAKWGGEHFDKRLGAMVPNKRSSKLSTKEFSDYMEWLVRFAAETCGCIVPLPGESEAA